MGKKNREKSWKICIYIKLAIGSNNRLNTKAFPPHFLVLATLANQTSMEKRNSGDPQA